MRALSQPREALSVEAARERLLEIRQRQRPRLLQDLRDLYRRGSGSAAGSAEIEVLELRLWDLDCSLSRILSALRKDPAFLGWETRQPELHGLEVQGNHRASAEARLFFSPENHDCVHGPCTLLPLTALAETLLISGEDLQELTSVTWSEPIRHSLRLAVADRSVSALGEGRGAVHGSFRTSLGRNLDFQGVQMESVPVFDQAGYNALSQSLVAGQSLRPAAPDGKSRLLDLNAAGMERCRQAAGRSRAWTAAILTDLVPIAILNWRKGVPMLDCGFKAVPLHLGLDEILLPGCQLELRYRPDLSHRSTRSGLWIAWYDFRYRPFQTAFSRTAMAEAESIQSMMRRLHALEGT